MTDTKEFEQAARETANSANDFAQDFTADLAALRADIVKLTACVGNLVKSQTSDTVYGAVDAARQRLSDGAATAKDRLSGASSELEASIERNPLVAVLIAMGAGLVIGLLSRGRQ